MRVCSLFSGIGGIDLACERAGMTVVFQCEKDKMAHRVLRHHWPEVQHHDDITTLECAAIPAVDLVAGGSPCQDWSVAGKRAGLAGKRGVLFEHMVRVASDSNARWILWENVPGVFSQHQGRDFARVLGDFTGFTPEVPKEGWRNSGVCWGRFGAAAWRVFDAQFAGVAQRRRRVFVVVRLGDALGLAGPKSRRNAGRLRRLPGEVLFESGRVCWNPPPRGAAGQEVAGTLGGGSGSRGFTDDLDHCGALIVEPVAAARQGRGDQYQIDETMIVEATAATLTAGTAASDGVSAPGWRREDDENLVIYQCNGGDVGPLGTLRHGNGNETGGVPFTVVAGFDLAPVTSAANRTRIEEGLPQPTLSISGDPRVIVSQRIRRLTPTECARLQGLPDTWLDLPNKPLSDAAKYRLIGNSVAVPVVERIAKTLMAINEENP